MEKLEKLVLVLINTSGPPKVSKVRSHGRRVLIQPWSCRRPQPPANCIDVLGECTVHVFVSSLYWYLGFVGLLITVALSSVIHSFSVF